MADDRKGTFLIIGATGTQGRAVARRLLERGQDVRALTRTPSSGAARALAEHGAEIHEGNLDDPRSVESAMRGVDGVYLVTDFFKNGIDGEIRHGKRVADLCKELGVAHLVHASVAGADRPTSVPHFESKRQIEGHIRSLGIPATFLRPTIFMEDLTDKQYFPPASWGMMPKLVGASRPVQWVSVEDIAVAAVNAFLRPDESIGHAITLVGDVLTMEEARAIFADVNGKRPFALPMPTFLFRRMVSDELVRMWEWLATNDMTGDAPVTRAYVPEPLDMKRWLRARQGAKAA